MSRLMTKPTKWFVRPANTQNSLGISAQSDQSLHCPHEETLGPQLPIERTAKTLIRLGGCPGWSESSLGAKLICCFCHEAANAKCSIRVYICDSYSASETLLLVQTVYDYEFGEFSGSFYHSIFWRSIVTLSWWRKYRSWWSCSFNILTIDSICLHSAPYFLCLHTEPWQQKSKNIWHPKNYCNYLKIWNVWF